MVSISASKMPSSFHHSQFADMLWLHLQTWNAQISRQLYAYQFPAESQLHRFADLSMHYSHERQTLFV